VSRFRVDLRSDTVSVPSLGMRNAMAHADVGDDVFGEDPTVNALEERVARMLGFERAVFMPSGTMSNGVAVRVLAEPGDEVICGSRSHVYIYEGAQAALNAGIQLHRIDERPEGLPDPADMDSALARSDDIHFAPRRLVCLENTHNTLGGRVIPRERLDAVKTVAEAHGARLFLDGARLWHAAVALRCDIAELCEGFSMVTVCFSKGLGCPVGSVLAGGAENVDRARWFRKRHGGGMRQAGILAAACHYALDHNLKRLERTHTWAKTLARAAAASPILEADPENVESNIVLVRSPGISSESVVATLGTLGIGCLTMGPSSLRLVTHLSLADRDVRYAADILATFGG